MLKSAGNLIKKILTGACIRAESAFKSPMADQDTGE